ncbi:MAG: c-type cytochrome [Candidatus Dadabacteria bacterium]
MKRIALFSLLIVFATSCGNNQQAKKATSEVEDPKIQQGLDLITKSDCFTCHKVADRLVGPAYDSVALRYKDTPGIEDTLAHKIIKGGSGNWGAVPMLPHPNIKVEDAKLMAHYVLSLKPE